MIEIVYDRANLNVTVKGHAGSAEHGHDLVCSAVSILCYTLGANVAKYSTNKKQVRNAVVRLDDGDAEISCRPVHGFRAVVTLVFDVVCEGFLLMSQQYPDYVTYSVKG